MIKETLLPMLLFLLFLPAVNADSNPVGEVTQRGKDCTNDGVIVQATTGANAINCEGECTNNGVIVQAGTSSAYSCKGPCTNNGVYAWTGKGGGCGHNNPGDLPGACIGETCTIICDNHTCSTTRGDQQASSPQGKGLPEVCHAQVAAQAKGLRDPLVECGGGNECSVAQNPGCWTVRLTCTIAHNQTHVVEVLEDAGVRCHTWQTAPDGEVNRPMIVRSSLYTEPPLIGE